MMNLQAFIDRLTVLPPFHIAQVTDQGIVTGVNIVPASLAAELVVAMDNLPGQMQTLPLHIAEWGRLSAMAQRVWERAQRDLRVWKAQSYLEHATPPADADEEAQKKWKKPTDKWIESQYRLKPQYALLQDQVEAAAEACNSAQFVLEAFKAKKDMLRSLVGPTAAAFTT